MNKLMHLEENPLKEIFYNQIQEIGENKIRLELTQKKSGKLIYKILQRCKEQIQNFENGFEIFATILLHYFLTNMIISSQRKIKKGDVEFDIIIPDFQTLVKTPQNAIILYIPLNDEKSNIDIELKNLVKVQPNKKNIWIISENIKKSDYKTFDLNSFPTIIDEIEKFLFGHRIKGLKILKNNF